MKKLVFSNPGLISILDLTTMGNSSKRGDDSKIGKFDSGLKYALAILYRNHIPIEIYSGLTKYTLSTTVLEDRYSNKVKEVLVINEYQAIDEDGTEFTPTEQYITAFSPELGYNWKLFMAIREIYSNMLDEGGKMTITDDIGDLLEKDYTVISIDINDQIQDILDNWNNYFLPRDIEPIYDDDVKIYPNFNSHLRLYKNGILVHEDLEIKSKYIYDYYEASIDEMRMLNDKETFLTKITNTIRWSNNELFLTDLLTNNPDLEIFELMQEYYHYSDTFVKVVNELYSKGLLQVRATMINELAKNNKAEVGIKLVQTYQPDWGYNSIKVVVEEKELTFDEKIKDLCGKYKLNYPISKATVSNGYKVLPDMYNKTLFVSEDFTKEDLWELIRAEMRISTNDRLGEEPFKIIANFYK